MILKEACVENFTNVPEVIARGVKRIELCDNLAVGGTTVSKGVMQITKTYCDQFGVLVMAIIRPRGGDFVYSQEEEESMKIDIRVAQEIGVKGIVIGALTAEKWIDEPLMEELIHLSQDMEITFHMAFDAIIPENQLAAIDWLVDHKVHRILTHGSILGNPIEENIIRINEYIQYANGRIVILPGGGITKDNLENVSSKVLAKEFHGTKIV